MDKKLKEKMGRSKANRLRATIETKEGEEDLTIQDKANLQRKITRLEKSLDDHSLLNLKPVLLAKLSKETQTRYRILKAREKPRIKVSTHYSESELGCLVFESLRTLLAKEPVYDSDKRRKLCDHLNTTGEHLKKCTGIGEWSHLMHWVDSTILRLARELNNEETIEDN